MRGINSIIPTHTVLEGGGFKVRRPVSMGRLMSPFLLLDEMGPANYGPGEAVGAPWHPHRGFETVTYMLHGEFEHEDSTGGKGKMKAGDVQWMKTGSGIIHSEMPAMSDGKLQGFQLWINMPAKLKMSKPEYIYIDSKEMQIHKDLDKTVKTIAGKFQKAEGPIKGHNLSLIHISEPTRPY